MAEVSAPKTPWPSMKVLMVSDSYPPQFIGGGGQNAQKRSLQYDWNVIFDKLEQIYNSLC